MTLPEFRYHPDPIASGSIQESGNTCVCCKQARGYIYVVSAYCEGDYDEVICPWCIADGSAYRELDATFVDSEALRGEVPDAVMEELTERTPGFASWQTEEWPVCCGDATAFIAPVGITELRSPATYEWEGPVMTYIVQEMKITGGGARRLIESLDRENGPTAYVFRCLHCMKHHFHIDFP